MKKYIISFISIAAIVLAGCKKSGLQLVNPNSPTPKSLQSEEGIKSFALGLYEKWIANVPNEGGTNVMQVALTNHSIMGDEEWVAYGNWGWRWADQVYAITLPAPYNTKVVNPNGVTQEAQLKTTNSRQAADRNSFVFEWEVCYFMISQANILLTATDDKALTLSGDAATKKAVLQAWANWWKGFAYSRIGSMYLAGVINNATDGTTNGTYVDHNAIITEANADFDKASAILGSLTETADYDDVMESIVPSFCNNKTVVAPDMWVRQIYSYEARNYLVNHKVASMVAADWTQVAALAGKGLLKTDNVFTYGMDPSGTNDLAAGFFHPFAVHDQGNAFAFVSERLIQDFKPGDNRFTQGFAQFTPTKVQVNLRGRGMQFGTRWYPINIEDGGLYSTDNNNTNSPIPGATALACSWDETALTVAESKIRSGDIDGGLALVDAVRDNQNSGLAHVANTGLLAAAALEELRRERRIGLYLRGLAFYDARRWGVTAPASSGGGRANAIVMVPGSLIGGSAAQALPCFMEYNYMDYWDVPQNELDFNSALAGSAPIAN